jgi:hypothetical protein
VIAGLKMSTQIVFHSKPLLGAHKSVEGSNAIRTDQVMKKNRQRINAFLPTSPQPLKDHF